LTEERLWAWKAHYVSRSNRAALDAMIAEATVDCYTDSECGTGFSTMFDDNLARPFQTVVLGVDVTVTGINLTLRRSLWCGKGADVDMDELSATAGAFVAMAHRIVWCTVATVDSQGRPRSRVMHPIWEWDGQVLLGFDPAAIGVPGWDAPGAPGFVVLRLMPWRLRVHPLSVLASGGRPRDMHTLVWQQ
jgi:hypothetical protein